MTLPLELCGREKDADSKGTEPLSATQLFFLLTTQLCLFSLFIFHAVSWHERELFPSWCSAGYGLLSGWMAHNKLGQGWFFWIYTSKQPAMIEKQYFP